MNVVPCIYIEGYRDSRYQRYTIEGRSRCSHCGADLVSYFMIGDGDKDDMLDAARRDGLIEVPTRGRCRCRRTMNVIMKVTHKQMATLVKSGRLAPTEL